MMMMHQRKSRVGTNIRKNEKNIYNAQETINNTDNNENNNQNYRRRRLRRRALLRAGSVAPWKEWMFSVFIFLILITTLLLGPIYYNTNKGIVPLAATAASKTIFRGTTNASIKNIKSHHHDTSPIEEERNEKKSSHHLYFVDKSPWYRRLRQEFDLQQQLQNSLVIYNDEDDDEQISTITDQSRKALPLLEAVQKIRNSSSNNKRKQFLPIPTYPNNSNSRLLAYDVFSCPKEPPIGYPAQFPIVDILQNWNPDDVFYDNSTNNNSGENSKQTYYIYQGLCIFDYFKPNHYEYALNYQRLEVPFVLKNHPHVLPTVIRWATPNYLENLLRDTRQRTEYSKNNHFMFWRLLRGYKHKNKQPPTVDKGWKPPTDNIKLTYSEWVAHVTSIISNTSITDYNNQDHWYFRLSGCMSMIDTEDCDEVYLFDELPFFQPEVTSNFFVVDSSEYRGINCRFGMAGSIAENHFDGSRNMIVLLGGQRRYILSHPSECRNFALLPQDHPSGRHSAVDFSNAFSEENRNKYPNFFTKATANEVVLEAGDSLYLPTYWMHYIVSLTNFNYQCNCRSGMTHEMDHFIRDCGF